MSKVLMGVESEWALVPEENSSLDKEATDVWLKKCQKDFASLSDGRNSGLFLGNGGRVYIDGHHPEYCTPECTNPFDVTRYLLSFDQYLLHQSREGSLPMFFSKMNVDYLTKSTWGCHESYLTSRDPESLAPYLIPHLITRVLYTGAGGFNPKTLKINFFLSPRAPFLTSVIGSDSTSERPIYHLRSETLSKSHYRCHVIYGENLFSALSIFLKCGTTALIIALAEGRKIDPSAITLEYPLVAARAAARASSGRVKLTLQGGTQVTPLQIQDYYLQIAKKHLGASFMPPWAGEVCERWEKVLRAFYEDPSFLQQSLDGHIKLSLFQRFLQNHGLNKEDLRKLNLKLHKLEEVWKKLSFEIPVEEEIQDSEIQRILQKVGNMRRQEIDQILHILEFRHEILALDLHFSRIDEQGLFYILEESGLLSHQVEGTGGHVGWLSIPPSDTRAFLRGNGVTQIASGGERGKASWEGVYNLSSKKYMDLSNPFVTRERWEKMTQDDIDSLFSYSELLDRMMGNP